MGRPRRLIGVVGGLGAIQFYTAQEVATQVFLGGLAGYAPPTPTREGGDSVEALLGPVDPAVEFVSTAASTGITDDVLPGAGTNPA